ncbi:acyltransferase family protein [Yimella sp. cx-51]|uniref:acyltransferase family protein n=1 Tax=Yimella sp. cx-51 TaxID=2770551 RepID=UPI00165D8D4A|nr:acyltransferase family protein [Yimella sp. cx-51]MBC9957792.1 acyltransferase family protein [Yimella sp. cx-51]QTH36865.1 acyltransferase family protein [Yimella sp. cx-51]
MPRPVERNAAYFPGLDGIRTLAVTLVILYHLGFERFSGGLLGVGVFFTLSGFLITSILINSWGKGKGLGLKMFWVRRARRLLPAVILLLIVGLIGVAVLDMENFGRRFTQAIAALFYVANWHTIFSGDSYFDATNGPGPFGHLWSLAIEEQFYIVWPLLLALLLIVTGAKLRRTAAVTAALAGASFFLLNALAVAGGDNTRAYEGTDTRAGGLLLGAAFALMWQPHVSATKERSRLHLMRTDVIGFAGVAAILWLSMTTKQNSLSLYSWGLLVLSVATVAVMYAACSVGSVTAIIFGLSPMRWIGERSYGIYLWHMPVAVFTPETFFADNLWIRSGVQVAFTVVLAALSWSLVEDPIRRHGFLVALGLRGRRAQSGRRVAWLTASTGAALFVPVAAVALLAPTYVPTPADSSKTQQAVAPNPLAGSNTADPSGTPTPTVRQGPVATKCEKTIHLGDSTSVGLMSPDYLPVASDREDAQLKKFGVTTFIPEISGARSIVETVGGSPNAEAVVDKHLAQGYNGCWIIAMGTNDSANQVVGGTWPYDKRVALLMDKLKDQPVMWLTVKTLKTVGPYANKHQIEWNNTLKAGCAKYPNMRIYDWASEVQDPWYIKDGIHFTTPGYQERARRIARAFAIAFPKEGDSPAECVVGSN